MFNDYGMNWEASQKDMLASDFVIQEANRQVFHERAMAGFFIGIVCFCIGCVVTMGVYHAY